MIKSYDLRFRVQASWFRVPRLAFKTKRGSLKGSVLKGSSRGLPRDACADGTHDLDPLFSRAWIRIPDLAFGYPNGLFWVQEVIPRDVFAVDTHDLVPYRQAPVRLRCAVREDLVSGSFFEV